MSDLLDLEQQLQRAHERIQAAALAEIMDALKSDSIVAWCELMNTEAVRVHGLYGFQGCPEVIGQMKDGRLLAVAVNAVTGRIRPAQAAALERIRKTGGVAFTASDKHDVWRALSPI